MMAMCFTSIVVVALFWFILGYSLAFAPDIGGGIIGGLDFIGMNAVEPFYYPVYSTTIPHLLFAIFQMMFAIITVAIVASPFADRAKFSSFIVFCILWLLLVYSPIAHWVWGDGGFLNTWGVLDWAGGSVVHVNAGFSALAAAFVIKPRKGYKKEPMEPSNVTYVLLGTALLWIGWFGFNGGSGLAANGTAVLALFNTFMASCTAGFVWLLIVWFKTGKASMLGLVTGVLAGLVGITPAAGFVSPLSSLVIGASASIASYFVLNWRTKSSIDESLDAWSVHGISGLLGAILTGVFAGIGAQGLISGKFIQVLLQGVGALICIAYSFGVTFALVLMLKKTIGLRVSPQEEYLGLDITQHGEQV
jgi:Amt family ammonium transporter